MRFPLPRLLLGLLLLAAPAAFAQTTTTAATTSTVTTTTVTTTSTTTTTLAVVWQVVLPTDCSGLVAASGLTTAEVSCCTLAGDGTCNTLQNFGTYFERFVTFASGTGGYTSGGDLITATQLARLGLTRISHAICYNSTTGRIVRWRPTTASGQRAPKIQLFTSGGTELSGATSVSNEAFSCLLFGYQ